MLEDNEIVIFKEEYGLRYMQFRKLLELGINHLYTLKSDEINFAPNNPLESKSYEIVAKILNISKEKILVTKQPHKDSIRCVDEKTKTEDLMFDDGIMTDKSGIALATKNADCILFNFYDPVKKVIANVHSGWKSTYMKIAEKAVIKMITNYGCKPEDIYCFVNPSIREDHFEVDSDVMELGKEIFKFTNRTNEFIKKGRIFGNSQKYNIDTVLINRILLEGLGLKPEKIIDCKICSVCNKADIASARADYPNNIRAISVMMM